MDKERKDPDTIDLGAPRLAQYMHKAWKKPQNTVYWGRHQTCSKERIEVLSDSIERDQSARNTPSLLYPESCSDGNWRVIFEKVLRHLGVLQRFSLRHDWMKDLGPEVAQRTRWTSCCFEVLFDWGFYPKTEYNRFLRSIMSLWTSLMCGLPLNSQEDHQDPLHCHQVLEDELDDGVPFLVLPVGQRSEWSFSRFLV